MPGSVTGSGSCEEVTVPDTVPGVIPVGNTAGMSGLTPDSVGNGVTGQAVAGGPAMNCKPLDCYVKCRLANIEQQKRCVELNKQCQVG